MFRAALIIPLFLHACWAKDETISAFTGTGTVWTLTEFEGGDPVFSASITFPEQGQIAGKGPCNSFTAAQSAPYPWVEITDLAATKRACPELDGEAKFFQAISAAVLAEVAGKVMILTTQDGSEMVFGAVE